MGLRRLRFHRLRPVWDLDIRCLLAACLHILYLLLVGAIPQGYPAREAPPKGQIKIVRAAPGDDAGILGAALLAREHCALVKSRNET